MRLLRRISVLVGATAVVVAGAVVEAPASFAATTTGPITIGSGLSLPSGVAVDSAGNVYIADGGNNRVVEVTPSGVQSALGSGFNDLLGIASNSTGTLYVSDAGNYQVEKIAGGVQTTIASGTTVSGIAADNSGNAFFIDYGNERVQEISQAGVQSTVMTGLGAGARGLAVDSSGNLYVADSGKNQVLKAAPGGTPTTIGSGLSEPDGVAVSSSGDVYIADFGNNRVVKVTPAGTQSTVGSGFSGPYSVAVDPSGDLYVAENSNSQVVELTPPGAPTGVSVTYTGTNASTAGDATVSWTAPADGGSSITGYTVTATDTTNSPWSQTCSSTTTSCSLVSLRQRDNYTYTVTATNAIGAGPASAVVGPQVVPTTPTVGLCSTVTDAVYGDISKNPLCSVYVSGAASGSIQFTANGQKIGQSLSVSAGSADGFVQIENPSDALTKPAGTYTIGAIFTPTDTTNFTSATQLQTFPLTVDPGATTTTVSVSPSPTVFGQAPKVTASESGSYFGSSFYPSGKIDFILDGKDLGSVPVDSSGNATSPALPSLTVGNHSVVATFTSTDSNYAGSTSTTTTFTVNKAGTTVSNPTSTLSSVSTAVTPVAPGAGTPTGTVTFSTGSTTLGTATVSNNGTATLSTTAIRGSMSVTATYGGDANFTGSTVTANVSEPTAPAAPTSVTAMAGDATAGVSWTAPADGGSAITGYVVTAHDATAGADSTVCSGSESSTATSCTATGLTNGDSYTFTVTATNAAGTSDPSAASNTVIPKHTPTLTLSGVPSSTSYGTTPTVAAAVSPSLAGTVQFSVNGVDLGYPVAVNNGIATTTLTDASGNPLRASATSYTIGAVFTPSASDTADTTATATTQSMTVNPVTTSTTLTAPSGVVVGQPSTVTATESPAVPGSMEFTVDGNDLGSAAVNGSGAATSPTISGLSVGNHTVVATFTPTDQTDYTGSPSSAQTLVVSQADTTTSKPTVSLTSISTTVNAVAPGAGMPTGTVTFYANGTSIGTATLTLGTATLNYVSRGATTISAAYSGDSDFNPSSTTDSTVVTNPTITATVTSRLPKNAAGWYRTPVTVTFTCTAGSAALSAPCPTPVTLTKSAAAQRVSETILDTDGGIATTTISGINIDRVAPAITVHGVRDGVTYTGAVPTITCTAKTGPSGLIRGCKVTTTRSGSMVHYVASATSKAGITRTVRAHIFVNTVYIAGVKPLANGNYPLRKGTVYDLRAYATGSRAPVFLYAAPLGARPGSGNARMAAIGNGLWQIRISLGLTHYKTWVMAVRIGKVTHQVVVTLS